MPKITYTPSQGLVQSAGSGVSFGGSQFVGALKKVIDGTGTTASQAITGSYLAGVKSLLLSDSGAVLLPVTATLYSLPSAASSVGFNVMFVNATSDFTSSIVAPTNCIKGDVRHNTNGSTFARISYETAQTRLTFTNPKVGDCLTITCDGTNYFVDGWCNAATSGTI